MSITKNIIKSMMFLPLLVHQSVYAFNLNEELLKATLNTAIERYKDKYPAFSPNGVIIPQDFILQQLKQQAETPEITINQVILKQNQGVIDITAKKTLDLNLKLNFTIQQLDWKNGFLIMKIDEQKEIVNTNIFGKIIGSIALSIVQVATGKTIIQNALANTPFTTILNDGLVKIHLNRIDALQKLYTTELANRRIADYIGIQDIKIEDKQIHLHMGRI